VSESAQQVAHPRRGDRQRATRCRLAQAQVEFALASGQALPRRGLQHLHPGADTKLVKRIVRRPRPATLLPGTRRRGPDATGLGYLSGHAGVAVALGAAALPHLGPAGRALTLAAVPTVGLTRAYVGAHLPLDTAGGAALGLAVDAALALVQEAGWPATRQGGTAAGNGACRCPRVALPGCRVIRAWARYRSG